MKRWALLTIVLYFLCMSVLTAPILLMLSGWEEELFGFFYLFHVPILLLVQVVLLLVPVAVKSQRPIKRRKIAVSAIVVALPMAAMVLGVLSFSVLMVWGENSGGEYIYGGPYPLIIVVLFWIVWGIVFYKSYSSANPLSFTSTITRWLLCGSILEILIAIPGHIISRHRNECCAPTFTLLGIATGLAVALFAFGPGMFCALAEKIRTKNGKQRSNAINSDS